MEGHPEENHHSKHQTQGHDALFGLFLRQFFASGRTAGHGLGLLLAALSMTESAAEQVVDSDREDERGTGYCKREVIGIVARIAQAHLGILLDLDGSRRSKECTDVNGHVEDREARVALVLVLRIVVEVAYHHLQVSLEQAGTEADEQQGAQHDNQCHAVATQRN